MLTVDPVADFNRYLDEFYQIGEEEISNEEQFLEKIVGNPIHTFRLVKRFAVDLDRIIRPDLALDSKCIVPMNDLPRLFTLKILQIGLFCRP